MTIDKIVEFFDKYLHITLLPHQIPWLGFMHRHRWSHLEAPREHGKSTIMVGYATYCICLDHDIRILIASHKEELADEFARNIQINLENPEIQLAFEFKPGRPWGIGKAFLTDKTYPVIKTVAKEAGMLGGRFDIVFFDDLLTVKNTGTERRRAKLERWINSEVIPALDHTPKQKQVVIGTRKHLEDWYSKIIENPYYEVYIDQLYKTVDGEKVYLWPERFNEEEEDRLRATLTPQEFAMEYMNSPIAAEGLYFRREWVKYWGKGHPLPAEEHLDVFMGIDPSMGEVGDRSGYMAVAVIAFDRRKERQNIYVLDLYRNKKTLGEQMDIILAKKREWSPIEYCIESCMVNKRFALEVKEELPDIRLVDYKGDALRGTSEMNKRIRIENLIGRYFKKGIVYLRDPTLSPMTKLFMEAEYLQFPEGGKDMLDALNMAVDNIDMRKLITRLPISLFGSGRRKKRRRR